MVSSDGVVSSAYGAVDIEAYFAASLDGALDFVMLRPIMK